MHGHAQDWAVANKCRHPRSDFYFTDDHSKESLAALAAGAVIVYPTAAEPSIRTVAFANTTDLSKGGAPCKWKDMRRALLLQTAERDILSAARAANPLVRVTLKFPNWYDSYQDMGYDVVNETAVFDSIWVGTESRDYFDARWGGNPAYHGFFLMRWFESLTACAKNERVFATRGGWFDTLGTSPDSYVERECMPLPVCLAGWLRTDCWACVQRQGRRSWVERMSHSVQYPQFQRYPTIPIPTIPAISISIDLSCSRILLVV